MNRLQLQNLFSHMIEDLKSGLSNKTTRIISNKLIKRTILNLEKSLKLLDSEVSKGKISDDAKKKIYSLISNKKLKEYMGLFIAEYEEHNMDYLCVEICSRIRNNLSDYYNVLKKYKIYDPNLTEQIICKYSIEELDNLLDKLMFKYGLKGADAYRILFYSNVDRVNHVFDLMNMYLFYIDRSFDLSSFLFRMCNLEEDYCALFGNNTRFLSLCGVQFIVDSYSSEKLISNDKLMDNMVQLSSYGLFFKAIDYSKKSPLFEILSSDNLVEQLDMILEMGCYEFLENDLSSLEKNNAKRLQVLKCIGTPVVDQETYNITMSTNNFIIDDEELDSEIYSAVNDTHIKLDITIDDLECFKLEENKYLYSIGGVLVSVNKVKRLLEEGNDIYTSIITGLVISDDEYNSMMDALQPLQYRK